MGNFSSSKRNSSGGGTTSGASKQHFSPLELLSQAEAAAVHEALGTNVSSASSNIASMFWSISHQSLANLSSSELKQLDLALGQWMNNARSVDDVKKGWMGHAEIVLRGSTRANRENFFKCMSNESGIADAESTARLFWMLLQFAVMDDTRSNDVTIVGTKSKAQVGQVENVAAAAASTSNVATSDVATTAFNTTAGNTTANVSQQPQKNSQSNPTQSPDDDTKQDSKQPPTAPNSASATPTTPTPSADCKTSLPYIQMWALLRGLIVHSIKFKEQNSYGVSFSLNPPPSTSNETAKTDSEKENCPGIDTVTADAFSSWIDTQVPGLLTPARDFILRCIGGTRGSVPALGSPEFRLHRMAGTRPSEVAGPADIFALSCSDAALRTTWTPLFTSGRDGRSFTTLVGAITAYPAPTLLLIRDQNNRTFGAFAKSPWQESHEFFGGKTGGAGSFLFSLRPTFRVFRARGSEDPEAHNFQYLNARNKHALKGIGLGGSVERPRLFLNEDLDMCRASNFGLTYEMGPLRSTASAQVGAACVEGGESLLEEFEPVSVEVWGLGGEESDRDQMRAKGEHLKMIMARRKVDMKQFANSEFDREFLLGSTFSAVNSKQDR